MLHPPGIATRARPNRASSGPSTRIDARIRLTSSYGVSTDRTSVASTETAPSTHSVRAPRWSSTSVIVRQSWMRGTLSITLRPSARSEAAISFSAEFFAPATRTVPESGCPP